MASLQDIRRRISSVKNTRKITKALELVAGARLRRAQLRIEEMRPYADRMQELMVGTARAASSFRNLALHAAARRAARRDRRRHRRSRPRGAVQRTGAAAGVRARAVGACGRARDRLARDGPQGRVDAAFPPLRADATRGPDSPTSPRTRMHKPSRTSSPSSTRTQRSIVSSSSTTSSCRRSCSA